MEVTNFAISLPISFLVWFFPSKSGNIFLSSCFCCRVQKMADSGFGKKTAKCPNCSSTSQKGAPCVSSSKTRLIPELVAADTSDTSSLGEPDTSIPLERKKEQQLIKYKAFAKDVVNIKDSVFEHKSKSHSLIPSLASCVGPCQLIHCLLNY